MNDVYYLNNEGPKYTDKAALIADARLYFKNTGKTPTYTKNQNECMHYFTAEELGETPQTDNPFHAKAQAEPTPEPREFKLGDVVRINGVESPQMVVHREPCVDPTVGVLWWSNGVLYRDSFQPELLIHID